VLIIPIAHALHHLALHLRVVVVEVRVETVGDRLVIAQAIERRDNAQALKDIFCDLMNIS